jgi:hypothetical protein
MANQTEGVGRSGRGNLGTLDLLLSDDPSDLLASDDRTYRSSSAGKGCLCAKWYWDTE